MEKNNRLVNYWNKSSEKIPQDKDESPYAVDKEVLFPRHAIVCDLGGGMGADAIYFIQKGHRVTLLDISDSAIGRAKKVAIEDSFSDELQTCQVDLSEGEIPQADGEFDVVFSRLMLHYFRRSTLLNLY